MICKQSIIEVSSFEINVGLPESETLLEPYCRLWGKLELNYYTCVAPKDQKLVQI